MSALAHILTQRGIPVSGSDIRQNSVTDQLENLGATIFLSQGAENLAHFTDTQTGNSDSASFQSTKPQVVCSTAIKPENPEYRAAIELNYPIFHRSDLLAALIAESNHSISVAGTHGKTTTSSLISHLLVDAKLDPTVVVGGVVKTLKGNARAGKSDFLVAEADESDGSLVKFNSALGVITNIELDHPDHYCSLEQVLDIFHTFVSHTQQMLVCLDCETIRDRLIPESASQSFLTYSLDASRGADYSVTDIHYGAEGTTAEVIERGISLGQIFVPLLGTHNLSNSLAAIAIARQCEVSFDAIIQGLASFEGAKRRFEVRGDANGIRLIDDYAHHPSEIEVTLASARLKVEKQPDHETCQIDHSNDSSWKRVIAVFQPHRYSRASTFLQEFSRAFHDADQVIVMDIYSAGENNEFGINGQMVCDAIAQHHHAVSYLPSLEGVTQHLITQSQPGDLILFLGAGNLNAAIPNVLKGLQISGTSRPQSSRVPNLYST